MRAFCPHDFSHVAGAETRARGEAFAAPATRTTVSYRSVSIDKPEPSSPDSRIEPSRIEPLCRAAAAGDVDALEALLALHHAPLLGLARRKIGLEWRDRIDPEDLLQEVYVDAFAAIGGFEHRDADSFHRWLRRILETRFIDQVRHWTRKKRGAVRVALDGEASRYDALLEQCQPDSATPSRFARRAEALGAMMSCVARLPEDYRAVVQRVLLDEESYAAAAESLGRSPEAVRRMLSRATEKLRECLARASLIISRGE